jgi:hypothetical protein
MASQLNRYWTASTSLTLDVAPFGIMAVDGELL